MKEIYILLGPPTSGKSTLAKIFAETLGATVIRGKQVFPELVPLYEKDRLLIPDSDYVPVLREYLESTGIKSQHIILENIPRTAQQALVVAEWSVASRCRTRSIRLHLEEEEVIERFQKRRVCPNCDTSYHPKLYPASSDGRCSIDGAELVARAGDKVDEIKRGYQRYRDLLETVIPVLNRFGEELCIDASGTILETSCIIAARTGLRLKINTNNT